jgi:hypothetical protein
MLPGVLFSESPVERRIAPLGPFTVLPEPTITSPDALVESLDTTTMEPLEPAALDPDAMIMEPPDPSKEDPPSKSMEPPLLGAPPAMAIELPALLSP